MKRMMKLVMLLPIGLLLLAGAAAAQTNYGVGPGCSAIEGVDATTIQLGDSFTGRIGHGSVTGYNPQGKPTDDTDLDGLTDSLEECINDALVGYISDIDQDDSACIVVAPGSDDGHNNQRKYFTVTFSGTCTAGDVALIGTSCTANATCDSIAGGDGVCTFACSAGISQCSDQVDNDADLLIDYGEDPGCVDYKDDDELDPV